MGMSISTGGGPGEDEKPLSEINTKPENVNIAVDADGNVFWNTGLVPNQEALLERLKAVAVMDPQPEIHVRGDKHTKYEHIGRVIVLCQRSGIQKVGFITEPDRGLARQ
jgi:biopolymer transport protein ExbD